jgi:hypothetical protein
MSTLDNVAFNNIIVESVVDEYDYIRSIMCHAHANNNVLMGFMSVLTTFAIYLVKDEVSLSSAFCALYPSD